MYPLSRDIFPISILQFIATTVNLELKTPKAFGKEYPMARLTLAYGGNRELNEDRIRVLPHCKALTELPDMLR